jgi:hypothetical protein
LIQIAAFIISVFILISYSKPASVCGGWSECAEDYELEEYNHLAVEGIITPRTDARRLQLQQLKDANKR